MFTEKRCPSNLDISKQSILMSDKCFVGSSVTVTVLPTKQFQNSISNFQSPTVTQLALSPQNKLSSDKFLVSFNVQSYSMSLKVGEDVVGVSYSLDLGETPSNSASHPDLSCLHMEL